MDTEELRIHFKEQVLQNLPVLSDEAMTYWIKNPEELQNLLSPLLGPPLDLTIRVDYSVKPTYPDWAKKVMHPDLEATGEAEYDLGRDLSMAESFVHQPTHITNVQQWYEDLKRNNYLKSCFGLRDGEAIQKKGITVFNKISDGKPIPLWKSIVQGPQIVYGPQIVQGPEDDLYVPYLYRDGQAVKIGWRWLGGNFNAGDILAVCVTVGYRIVNRPLEE